MTGITTAMMSTRGQVVIPKQIRTSLGLDHGARFLVTAQDDMIVLKHLAALREEDYAPLLSAAQARKRL